jgi:uncharacterized protein
MAAPDIYLDACCFIYLVEGTPTWRAAIENRLRAIDSTARLVTSQLSRLECRTRPMRDRDEALLRRYDTLFSADRVSLVEIGEAIIDRATDLRARYGYKTPDAIHLATGIESGVAAFLTGDIRLQTCSEVRVEVIARA